MATFSDIAFPKQTLVSNGVGDSNATQWGGGKGIIVIDGDFSGATIKLQLQSTQAVVFVDYPGATLSAPGIMQFDLPAGTLIKTVRTGGVTPSVNVVARHQTWEG